MGYVVRFGQKAQFVSLDGVALFTKDQVALEYKGWQPLIEEPQPEPRDV